MTDIAEKLQAAMQEKGLSYGELSEYTGIPKSAVFRYVRGETDKIPLDRIQRMAAALGVSAAYLMGWEPEEAMEKITPPPPTPQQLRDEALLEMLHQLSPAQQDLILAQLQGAVHSQRGQGYL